MFHSCRAGISSFAYQGTNSHVVAGAPVEPAVPQQQAVVWQHARFWYQVRTCKLWLVAGMASAAKIDHALDSLLRYKQLRYTGVENRCPCSAAGHDASLPSTTLLLKR